MVLCFTEKKRNNDSVDWLKKKHTKQNEKQKFLWEFEYNTFRDD